MKTSARNQFFGKVSSITMGAVNDEIELEIAGGHKLVAVITHDSTKELELAVGKEAFALIKTSSIILVTDQENARFSARNRLSGVVSRLIVGAVNTEVIIDLPSAGSLAATITNESCAELGLEIGMQAMAIFKASSVILGVAL